MRKILLRPRSLRPNQAGDTIVEVLICIAVVAAILTGAFLVSNRSSSAVRDSEEHAQALQFLQGQVEQLRSDVANKKYSAIPAYPATFCYQTDGTYNTPNCVVNGLYTLTIVKNPGGLGPLNTASFTATVKWDAVDGVAAQEQLFYRTAVAGP